MSRRRFMQVEEQVGSMQISRKKVFSMLKQNQYEYCFSKFIHSQKESTQVSSCDGMSFTLMQETSDLEKNDNCIYERRIMITL